MRLEIFISSWKLQLIFMWATISLCLEVDGFISLSWYGRGKIEERENSSANSSATSFMDIPDLIASPAIGCRGTFAPERASSDLPSAPAPTWTTKRCAVLAPLPSLRCLGVSPELSVNSVVANPVP